MMMKIGIRDFQVISVADIEVGSGVTLVAGRNAQGKSSIAKAAACALTGLLQPGRLAKKDAGRLVRAGRKTATAVVSAPNGTVRAVWPDCKAVSDGNAPAISQIAAGIDSLIDMDAKERSKFLSDLLHTLPTREDFMSAFADVGLGEDVSAKVWEGIEALGWDGEARDLEDKGRTLKYRWADAAGEKDYGSEKAATWLPKGWTPDLETSTVEDLKAAVKAAQGALDDALRVQGADAGEVARLKAPADAADQRRAAFEQLVQDLAAAEKAYDEAEAHRRSLPAAEQDDGLRCPCCGKTLRLVTNMGANPRLAEAEVIGDAELRARRLAVASADGKLARAKDAVSEALIRRSAAQAAVIEAEKAADKLKRLSGRGVASSDSAVAVDSARAALTLAETRLRAVEAKTKTDECVRLLDLNMKVRSIVDPAGLRQSRLEKTLTAFNDGPLAEICASARWNAVRVEPDMSITFDGRPYAALAGHGPQIASDQFKARVVLQIAVAKLSGDPLVIIDAADLLDRAGRSGLINMLAGDGGIPALVTMTYSAPDIVPDLARAAKGKTYWVEAGVTSPLADAITAPKKKAA